MQQPIFKLNLVWRLFCLCLCHYLILPSQSAEQIWDLPHLTFSIVFLFLWHNVNKLDQKVHSFSQQQFCL